MRSFLSTILFCFCGLVSALATPSRREALTAIAVLERDPLSENAPAAAGVVLQFVEESEDVMCMLSEDTIPWIGEEPDPDETKAAFSSLLMAVYLAGNTKAQLAARTASDDPYSGWLAAIRAYRQIQAKKKISIPALDELVAMQAKGTLKRHAEEVKAKGDEAAPDPITPPSSQTPTPRVKPPAPSAPKKRDPSLIE
jgi:hypothetical protein